VTSEPFLILVVTVRHSLVTSRRVAARNEKARPAVALDGKLSSGLDGQVRVPDPAGNAQKGTL